VGTAQSPDGTADVLELKPADGTAPTRLFLDSSTHVPLMITWQGAAPQFGRRGGGRGSPGGAGAGAPNPPAAQGGTVPPSSDAAPPPAPQAGGDAAQAPRRAGPAAQATLQMTMADYKAVNGIKLPFTITRGINGQTNEEWTVSSYKLNQTLKPNTFEQKK
jgi:hypothetical protein